VTGHPALSVPCGLTAAGLPIGLQLVGRAFDEATLLRIGHAFESASPLKPRWLPLDL
jgi:aspartyl-tRNA(Asn)/glutamyl-tRNA(Gln) amidotransferase subunit A